MLLNELRILHWNIHSWRDAVAASNVDVVFDLIRDTDPHVVSLVEVDEPWGAATVVGELADGLGYSWIFVPSFEYGHETPGGGFGNALLTKLPILAVHQRQLVWPIRLYDGTEPSECRSVILARLGLSAASIWVGSTHLPRQDAGSRTAALARLADIVEQLRGHWIICGDFNTPASAWVDDNSRFGAFPWPGSPTYPTGMPNESIDYCIAAPGLFVEVEVLPASGSDHYPILLSGVGSV